MDRMHSNYPTPRSSSEEISGFHLNDAMDDISRGTAGDAYNRSTRRRPDTNPKVVSKYYNDAFAVRESESQPRDLVTRDAPIVVELKTNVIINDEYSFITQLSNHLAQHYERSESCVTIILHHSACLMLGGSFDPACVLEINTVSNSISPAVNRRIVLLTTSWLGENLQVEASRAVIRFHSIPNSDLGVGGNTILGEIDAMEKKMSLEQGGMKRRLSTISRRNSWFRPPSRAGSIMEKKEDRSTTKRGAAIDQPPALPALPTSPIMQLSPASTNLGRETFQQKAKKRKSLVNMFRR